MDGEPFSAEVFWPQEPCVAYLRVSLNSIGSEPRGVGFEG